MFNNLWAKLLVEVLSFAPRNVSYMIQQKRLCPFSQRMSIPVSTNSWRNGQGFQKWLLLRGRVCFELNGFGCILIISSCSNGEGHQVARCSIAFFRFANGRIFLCSCKKNGSKFLKKVSHSRISRITQFLYPVKINYPPLVVTLILIFLEFLLRVLQRVSMIKQIASTHMKTQNLFLEIS